MRMYLVEHTILLFSVDETSLFPFFKLFGNNYTCDNFPLRRLHHEVRMRNEPRERRTLHKYIYKCKRFINLLWNWDVERCHTYIQDMNVRPFPYQRKRSGPFWASHLIYGTVEMADVKPVMTPWWINAVPKDYFNRLAWGLSLPEVSMSNIRQRKVVAFFS